MPVHPFLTDDQRRLISDPFHGTGQSALQALAIVAVPHWLPAKALLTHFREDLLPQLPELLRRDLVRVTGAGAMTVPDALRRRMLADEMGLERVAPIAARLIPIFDESPTPEGRIEASYLRLFVDPDQASRDMFADALSWASEPLFAFNLLQRLIIVWREFDTLWGLSGRAATYLRFVELMDPGRRMAPSEELAILDRLQPNDDPLLASHIDLRAGLALTALNQNSLAKSTLLRAYESFDGLNHRQSCAQASRALGRLSVKLDRFNEARRHYKRALNLSRRLDLPVGTAQSLQGLAEIDSFRGSLSRATENFETAIAILSSHGGRSAEANARVAFSQLLVMTGNLDAASQHIGLAMRTYDATGQKLGQANGLKAAAMVDLEAGSLDSAHEKNAAAQALYRSLGTDTGLAACTEIDAQIEMTRGDSEEASKGFLLAQTLYEGVGDNFGRASCLRDRGALALLQSDPAQAGELLIESAAQFEKIGSHLEAALSNFLAHLAGRDVDAGNARRQLIEAGAALPRAYRGSWAVATGLSLAEGSTGDGAWTSPD